MAVVIRAERSGDEAAIRALTAAAFAAVAYSDGSEPAIVDALRRDDDLALSLVAVSDDAIVGHIAFSPVAAGHCRTGWFGIGPVSVAPAEQRRGVGSMLMREGMRRLEASGAQGFALVGDPGFYARFGFVSGPDLRYGDLDTRYVQYRRVAGPSPMGELSYVSAFGPSA